MAYPISRPPEEPEQKLLRLISDASHEIVGPANQVSSLVALFVNRYRGRLDHDADDLLNFIGSAGARLSDAADALRTYYHLLSSNPERVCLNTRDILGAVLRTLQPELTDSGAEVTCGALPEIQGDSKLLTLLFAAVIRNSVKFCRDNIPPRIAISAEDSPPVCVFSVTDNGIGMDPQFAESVFTPFTRLNGHKYKGTGIGLAGARAAAEMMGGTMWVICTGEPGTTICFELPQAL